MVDPVAATSATLAGHDHIADMDFITALFLALTWEGRYLQGCCHRLIWLNPLAGGREPKAGACP